MKPKLRITLLFPSRQRIRQHLSRSLPLPRPSKQRHTQRRRRRHILHHLKRKLGLSRKAKAAAGHGPAKSARKLVDDALDELDRLKRKLDGD